ncbi:MAG: HAMP domain-containing sensor histidine kinase, partial [Pseudomonadota bacterium]
YQIVIKDNGPGIDSRFWDRVFEPFEVLDAGGRHNGVGMGLTIARKIVQTAGGAISLESEDAKGTTVLIQWPAHSLTAAAADEGLAA